MKQKLSVLLAAMGVATLLAGGCTSKEVVKTEAPAAPMAKAEAPKPPVQQPIIKPEEPLVPQQQQAPGAPVAGKSLDVMELPAANGNITFPHKQHQEQLKDCSKCHTAAPGKIAELGKDWAHKTCKGCHTEMKKGPTSCKDCHKK